MNTFMMKASALNFKKLSVKDLKKLGVVAVAAVLMTACASTPKANYGAAEARAKLTQLQTSNQLASRAPVAIKDAEDAVRAAEVPQKDKSLATHLVWIADHKIDIATALAQSRLLEDQRKVLSEQRETARLDSRTLEANLAHGDAEAARAAAKSAQGDAALARSDADLARQQADELQRQISDLNAKATDRGLIVTLGDLLFETDKSELKGGAANNLNKLAAFLNKYPDRQVMIEGHTDSQGSDDYNLGLSQRRADSVRSFLVSQGIPMNRLSASGKGEGFPVASNETTTGRQMNRRVEVVIANPATASAAQ